MSNSERRRQWQVNRPQMNLKEFQNCSKKEHNMIKIAASTFYCTKCRMKDVGLTNTLENMLQSDTSHVALQE